MCVSVVRLRTYYYSHSVCPFICICHCGSVSLSVSRSVGALVCARLSLTIKCQAADGSCESRNPENFLETQPRFQKTPICMSSCMSGCISGCIILSCSKSGCMFGCMSGCMYVNVCPCDYMASVPRSLHLSVTDLATLSKAPR